MGYLFLGISVFAGLLKGYCGKKTSDIISGTKDAVFLNLVRMLICVVLGGIMVFVYNDFEFLTLNSNVVLISALSGISTSFMVVIWLQVVKRSAYMLLDIFMMLGTLVPMLGGYFVFGEGISANQWIGFFILMVAVAIMCSYNNSIKVKLSVTSVLLLIACGVSNGLADFSQKIFVKNQPDVPISVFTLYTYIFSAASLAVMLGLMRKEKLFAGSDAEKVPYKKYIYIVVMSIALTMYSYFKTKAATYLSSAQLYPLSQGSGLILACFMSAALFKEKLTLKCVVGIVIAFGGLLVMNVL